MTNNVKLPDASSFALTRKHQNNDKDDNEEEKFLRGREKAKGNLHKKDYRFSFVKSPAFSCPKERFSEDSSPKKCRACRNSS